MIFVFYLYKVKVCESVNTCVILNVIKFLNNQFIIPNLIHGKADEISICVSFFFNILF